MNEKTLQWAVKQLEQLRKPALASRAHEEYRTCHNCEYWMKKYQQCEHPEQRQTECGEYMAPPNKTCELWESVT